VSRWADAFAALSGGSDTLDTMRHFCDPSSTVSQSVNSVTVPAITEQSMPTFNRGGTICRQVEAKRVAIVEYDGDNIPLAWSEGFAQLDPDWPPGDVPPRRWLAFIEDCGQFLESGFAARAAALGWGSFDIFGCDRDRPFARIDRAGLLWLLNGDRLIAMSENTATIEIEAGTRQTWRRKPNHPGRVLPWELVDGDHD
jgi:hypothetical protein